MAESCRMVIIYVPKSRELARKIMSTDWKVSPMEQFHFKYIYIVWLRINMDPDQLASSESR